MELFRQLALLLNEKGLEPVVVGVFYKTLEENGRRWSKSISSGTYRSDSATYCFKHEISFATIIQSGYEAFSLEKEHGVPVKMLQAHIARAKKTRDDLLDESQKRPRMMQDEHLNMR